MIDFSDFSKIDIRVGEILNAEEVSGSDKLIELKVNFGPEIGERTIFAGIKQWYPPTSLTGRKLAFVVNLATKKFKIAGNEYESQGMLIAADSNNSAILYRFDEDIPVGSKLR